MILGCSHFLGVRFVLAAGVALLCGARFFGLIGLIYQFVAKSSFAGCTLSVGQRARVTEGCSRC